ncbi:DNA-processing protein DprA [Pseudomonas sp. 91RF]|uniref:DNA-processing protein DprA n=1 Tax=Pseudomonas sp. 91RF TaxID=2292261 RepID=UPI000E667595|nr:DNA-processing protein DprA [Pseudomonas sp. 91RF]RIJ09705.1 DNA-processing protein DprA [Pseudomonas sp. 91RF]
MITISPLTKKILALSMLQGVGPATLRRIVSESLESAPVFELSQRVPAIAKAIAAPSAWELAQELAETQCDSAEKAGAYIISALDEGYPALLSATKDDPFILFVKGTLSQTPEKSVAIIGTRQPTKHGEMITRRMTDFFCGQRWSVVSGLALGCDGIAHRAAIESGGHTVAVLAHGLQTIAPTQHRKLAEDILNSGGALISEYRFGQGALPTQFVKRDRTQAGLCQGVVMIQSDLKGGSLHASRAALDYERWLAVPYPTIADEQANEPKIQANLMIANSGADMDRANLLKCHISRLSKVIVVRAKEDYPQLVCSPVAVLDTSELRTKLEGEESRRQTSLLTQAEDLPESSPDALHAHIASAEDILRDQSDSQSKGSRKNSEPLNAEQRDETPEASRDLRKIDVSPDYKADLTVQHKLL